MVEKFLPPVGESPLLRGYLTLKSKEDMFLPPVGESPLLRVATNDVADKKLFLPPVGESPLLSQRIFMMTRTQNVSTPCRGITSTEIISNLVKVFLKFLPPVGESPLLSEQKRVY